MISSGTTALATSSDTAVAVFSQLATIARLEFVNEGAAAGFFVIGGVSVRIPAGPSSRVVGPFASVPSSDIFIQRVAGGANMSGIFVNGY